MLEVVTADILKGIFEVILDLLTSLDKESKGKKQSYRNALRKIIVTARETNVYIRSMKENDKNNHDTESRLSVLWTELGFELEDLGLGKLAKRCQIKGIYWADPNHYDSEFLKKADISLSRMEQLARQNLI